MADPQERLVDSESVQFTDRTGPVPQGRGMSFHLSLHDNILLMLFLFIWLGAHEWCVAHEWSVSNTFASPLNLLWNTSLRLQVLHIWWQRFDLPWSEWQTRQTILLPSLFLRPPKHGQAKSKLALVTLSPPTHMSSSWSAPLNHQRTLQSRRWIEWPTPPGLPGTFMGFALKAQQHPRTGGHA